MTSGCDDMQLKRRNLPLLASSLMKLPKFLPCPKGMQPSLPVFGRALHAIIALVRSVKCVVVISFFTLCAVNCSTQL
jgi:hypothetical protein